MFDGIDFNPGNTQALSFAPSCNGLGGTASPLRLHGALDGEAADGLREMIVALGDFADHDVVLDMSAVGFLDGSGIGMIATLYRRLTKRGLTLSIVGACGQPAHLLRDLGLRRLMGEPRRRPWASWARRTPTLDLAIS